MTYSLFAAPGVLRLILASSLPRPVRRRTDLARAAGQPCDAPQMDACRRVCEAEPDVDLGWSIPSYGDGMADANQPGATPILSRLAAVDPRDVWAHEAHAFTPWLLTNPDVLGDLLGMDLVLAAAEHPVGGFALDLIGRDESTNETVIVENQLTGTDHTHLGQILTYAGGTDPVNIVWVATSFREEHRAALDWLNTRTDESTRFFGVELGVVRIDGSPPAPLLRLVVQPNDWGKKVKASTHADAALSTRNSTYQEFWTRFLDRIATDRSDWTRARKGPAQNWFPMPTGRSDLSYTCSFGRSGLCSEIYFQHTDPNVNAARFDAAHARKDQLEGAYGSALSFEPLAERKGCRIAEYRPGTIENSSECDDYITWFVDAQTRLRNAIAAIGGFTTLIAT
jgi:hypothetical protein